jgi:hypothetical protein
MRRVAVGAMAVAGLGLFGAGAQGLVRVDSKLADAASNRPPAVRDVRLDLNDRGDCPARHRSRSDTRRL